MKMDSDYSELAKQAATQIEQNNKLVAEGLQLHSNPNLGVVENQIAKSLTDDAKTTALTVLGLEHAAETTQNPLIKAAAYRDLAVLDQSMALHWLGADKEITRLCLNNDGGSAKWIGKLEQTDPMNSDLKDLKTIQRHMSEAVDSVNSQNPARKYNPSFDTTLLYRKFE